MKSFAAPLLIGIAIGMVTTGIIALAHDDFYWYRDKSSATVATTSIDAVFIENMIPHHQGALDMAELALTQAKTSEVKTLAQTIIAAQQEEIITMQAWYLAWFGTEVPKATQSTIRESDSVIMHDMSAMHMNSMTGNLNKLENAKNFDKEFVEEMIPHHEMAVMMAQMLLRTTAREEMKTLAQNIIDSQSKEIEDMRGWLEDWE